MSGNSLVVPRGKRAAGQGDYLRMLGDRVRTLRARRGMTRKILARDSGVSERYLAQLEAGQGNITITLLRQIAHAMGLPLADLLGEEPEQHAELSLLVQHLSRFSPKMLTRARALIMNELEDSLSADRRKRIALIGLRGAGKTTLGQRLSEKLGVPFVELVREIERDAGMELDGIFSLYGQSAYRRYERRSLESAIQARETFVLAAGGSIVSEAATFDILLSNCFTVWLRASPEEHMTRVMDQGDFRPMQENAEAMDDLRRILAGRSGLYSKADAIVDTSGKTIEQSLADLINVLAPATPGPQRSTLGAGSHS